MIYAAFTMWLVFTVFAGIGVYRMWAALGKPAHVNCALLPGTLVSQMAYIFGCLITGGEIKNAKMVPDRKDSGGGAPQTSDSPRLKVVGPLVASFMSLVACGGAILAVHSAMGKPVIERFGGDGGGYFFNETTTGLPKDLPRSWEEGWKLVSDQVHLVKHTCETWWDLEWSNWRVALFVYLAICLAVRLGPVSRPIRPTLGAVCIIAGVIAIIGAVDKNFVNLIDKIWPLLTYVWASLLTMLFGTLVVLGLAALWRIMTGKDKGLQKKRSGGGSSR
ncbi:MAG: hypothetical protein GY794_08185 [bacterium]|nr:hypothetical protein [bacterium]